MPAIHERTHTKKRPLTCDFAGCGKTFSESSNFAKHRKTHGEKGMHSCTIPGCGKNFHRSDQLKKHMKAHQEDTNTGNSNRSEKLEDPDEKLELWDEDA